jgi:PIN domain nuclease of toxin-antitoxin system
MTLMELAMLAARNASLSRKCGIFFVRRMENRFSVLPINAQICASAFALPPRHFKDPADRIIAATALAEGLTLITADREIRKSGVVPTIW